MTIAEIRRFVLSQKERRQEFLEWQARQLMSCRVTTVNDSIISKRWGTFIVWKAGKRGPMVIARRKQLSVAMRIAEA